MGLSLYLTSSPAGTYREWGKKTPYRGLNPANGLVEELKRDWRGQAACLLIAASPEEYEMNEAMCSEMEQNFIDSGLPVSRFDLCDARNGREMAERLGEYDVLVLGGGHVPTQNAFFWEIGLPEQIQNFDGIVMGISAGTMNCAKTVYAIPELEGESTDPGYRRFIEGLGLTIYNVIPHFQAVKDDVLDGRRVIEDMAIPDSVGRCFYALPDGSFILQRDGQARICGPAYRIEDGTMQKEAPADDQKAY